MKRIRRVEQNQEQYTKREIGEVILFNNNNNNEQKTRKRLTEHLMVVKVRLSPYLSDSIWYYFTFCCCCYVPSVRRFGLISLSGLIFVSPSFHQHSFDNLPVVRICIAVGNAFSTREENTIYEAIVKIEFFSLSKLCNLKRFLGFLSPSHSPVIDNRGHVTFDIIQYITCSASVTSH